MSIDARPVSVTRRTALRLGALAAPAILGFRAASAAGQLNVTAYDGFVPPELRRQFQADAGVEVRIRLAASQAPQLNLLVAERERPTTDICTVTGHRLHQFVNAGIIEPIDLSRLKNWGRINPIYRDADWLKVDGKVMGVPLVIGANVLVYDSREVKPEPDSWNALLDPRYKRRVTYNIEDYLLSTMLTQGADPTFMTYIQDPPAAARAVNAARDKLIANKPQILRFFEEGGELQQMMLGGDVVMAQTYSSAPARLILGGQPFRRIVPREGGLSFVYTFAIVKNGPNPDMAYRFLDALLGMPGIQAALARSAGYLSTFSDASFGLTEVEQIAYGLDPEMLNRLRFPRFEGQALSSKLIDKAVEEVRAG